MLSNPPAALAQNRVGRRLGILMTMPLAIAKRMGNKMRKPTPIMIHKFIASSLIWI